MSSRNVTLTSPDGEHTVAVPVGDKVEITQYKAQGWTETEQDQADGEASTVSGGEIAKGAQAGAESAKSTGAAKGEKAAK